MKLDKAIATLKTIFRKHSFVFWAVLIFTGFTFYYMTPQFLHINSTLYGFGDNTSGPIWKNSQPGQPLLGGFENKTNYPFGESIYNPVGYSLIVQATSVWSLSKVFGPIAGYNLFNMFGFIISALVMCGFVYALTRNKYIAILAGYAASFAPYFQVKVGGHPGYGYQALLIGVIWSFFNLLKHAKKKQAIILGALTATCFYFDPYFSLLAATCLLALGLIWVIVSWLQVRKNRISKSVILRQLNMLGLSAIVTFLLLMPLLFISVSKSNVISSTVTAARGNVIADARHCSILPYQYASPFVYNPIFTKLFGGNYYKTNIENINNNFPCGIGEAAVGISITILTVVGAALVIFNWEKLNKRRLRLNNVLEFEPKVFVFGIIAVGIAAMIMALPPARLGFVPTPSDVLIHITSTWRTIARFYVLVNISAVLFFCVALAYFANHFKQRSRILKVLFVILFFMIFIEYQAFKPFAGNEMNNFNYKKDVPGAYVWLGKQADIHNIAEYPLEREGGESNAGAYYLSMQTAHGKNLFNSALSNSPQENIRFSLKNLADPQTVPVLGALGIDAVVIHSIPEDTISKIPYLKVVYSSTQPSNYKLAGFVNTLTSYTPLATNYDIVIAKIVNPPQATTMLRLREGEFPRNASIIHSSVDWQYEALQDSHIDIAPFMPKPTNNTLAGLAPVCFEVRMSVPTDKAELTLIDDGKPGEKLQINGTYQAVQTSAKHTVQLHNNTGNNMEIENLGCKP